MLSVTDARTRALRTVERSRRSWAAALVSPEGEDVGSPSDAVLELVLHPPTEKAALADLRSAIRWVEEWRHAEGRGALRVSWASRHWPSAGTQTVPERVVLEGADAITAFAGAATQRSWKVLAERAGVIRERLIDSCTFPASVEDAAASVARAVRTHAGVLGDYSDAEFAELLDVIAWLVANPSSGRRVRELPIRGIHTKWLERHRRVTEDLYRAITGEEGLGLAESQSLVRLRFLDPALRPGGLTDVAVPLTQLVTLDVAPDIVFVFENLETVLALPELPRAVVVHGSGYAVGRLSAVPWIRSARLCYWGDLDSDGFRILDVLRSECPEVTSMLMDVATVERYRDLAVPEPRSAPGGFAHLTPEEDAARLLLSESGGLRIEQERIPWEEATRVIRGFLGH